MPDDASILQYAGFKVYTPSGSLQVVGGAQPSLRPNVAADLISATRGRFTVQVYNANRRRRSTSSSPSTGAGPRTAGPELAPGVTSGTARCVRGGPPGR